MTDPEKLPGHLLADEKITWLNGEEVVVATTVGDDCVLGSSEESAWAERDFSRRAKRRSSYPTSRRTTISA
jgi:hypothetical protein